MRESSAVAPVSVVLPAYNAEAFLEDAFASVALQRVHPAEIIVVDDASADGTAALSARLGARVLSCRRNRGPAAARNAGARIATQPWIAFLDADDEWHPDKIALQWDALQRWPDAALCFTDYDAIDARGVRTHCAGAAHAGYARLVASQRHGEAARFEAGAAIDGLVRSMFVRQSSVIVRRDAFLEAGGYDEGLRLAEDYELFLRLAAIAPAIGIERSLVSYLRREESLSADPLAEVRSIDDLWAAILNRQERYSSRMVARVRAERIPTLHRGVVCALRLGRFREARDLAVRAHRIAASPATLALCGFTELFDNPAGARLHGAVREIWRARPGTHPSH